MRGFSHLSLKFKSHYIQNRREEGEPFPVSSALGRRRGGEAGWWASCKWCRSDFRLCVVFGNGTIPKIQQRSRTNDLCNWDVICWFFWTASARGALPRWLLLRGTRLVLQQNKAGDAHTKFPVPTCTIAAPSCSCPSPSFTLCQKVLLLPKCPANQLMVLFSALGLLGWELVVSWGCVLRREPRENPVSCRKAAH